MVLFFFFERSIRPFVGSKIHPPPDRFLGVLNIIINKLFTYTGLRPASGDDDRITHSRQQEKMGGNNKINLLPKPKLFLTRGDQSALQLSKMLFEIFDPLSRGWNEAAYKETNAATYEYPPRKGDLWPPLRQPTSK
jgi:hypothetical protein